MRNERLSVVLVFLSAAVVLLWHIAPNKGMVRPFPLSDTEIDFRSYIWVGTLYAAFAVLIAAMWASSDKAKTFFNAAFILQVCLFIEYWINYNDPWGHIGKIPVHIATIRCPILAYFALKTIVQWNR